MSATKIPAYKRRLSSKDIIETRTLFPEEMREPFTWLAEYLRDECHAEVDVLEAIIREVGLPTTAGTIAKLICGRWDTDAAGTKTTPIISARNFIQLVDRVRKQARLKRVQGQIEFVETSAWQLISDYIEVRRAENAVCKFGMILGPTGSQKGACEKHYCLLNNHGACTYIEAPDSPSISKFTRTITRAFGVSQAFSISRQLVELEDSINRTRTLIIANIQRLYRPNAGWYQPVFNWLQTTQERTNCTIILEAAVQSDFCAALRKGREFGYFEQFVGRCGGEFLVLPDYPPAGDLLAIGAAFGLLPSPGGEGRGEGERKREKQTLALLEEIARREGRIRTLFHTLQKAARVANGGKQKLTLDHVRDAAGKVEMAAADDSLVIPERDRAREETINRGSLTLTATR